VLSHFTTSPRLRQSAAGRCRDVGCPSRVRTSVHGFKVRCPTTRRRGSGQEEENWSGRRDSNPRPSPWQGDALPTEPLPLEDPTTLRWCREPGSNWRHRDFQSRALPTELSRPDGQPAVGCPSAGRRIPRGSRGQQSRRRRPWVGSPGPRPRRAWRCGVGGRGGGGCAVRGPSRPPVDRLGANRRTCGTSGALWHLAGPISGGAPESRPFFVDWHAAVPTSSGCSANELWAGGAARHAPSRCARPPGRVQGRRPAPEPGSGTNRARRGWPSRPPRAAAPR
jgi:hypothetical protein